MVKSAQTCLYSREMVLILQVDSKFLGLFQKLTFSNRLTAFLFPVVPCGKHNSKITLSGLSLLHNLFPLSMSWICKHIISRNWEEILADSLEEKRDLQLQGTELCQKKNELGNGFFIELPIRTYLSWHLDFSLLIFWAEDIFQVKDRIWDITMGKGNGLSKIQLCPDFNRKYFFDVTK